MLVDGKLVVVAAILGRRDLITKLAKSKMDIKSHVILIYWSDRSLGGTLDGLCDEFAEGL